MRQQPNHAENYKAKPVVAEERQVLVGSSLPYYHANV